MGLSGPLIDAPVQVADDGLASMVYCELCLSFSGWGSFHCFVNPCLFLTEESRRCFPGIKQTIFILSVFSFKEESRGRKDREAFVTVG